MTKQEIINKLETIIADEVLTKDEQIYLSGTGVEKIKKVIDEFEQAVREDTITYTSNLYF